MQVVLFAMVAGHLPFEDTNTACLYDKILRADYKLPRHCSSAVRDLLARIFATDPTSRCSIADIRQHPWFTQVMVPPAVLKFAPSKSGDIVPAVVREVAALGIDERTLATDLLRQAHNNGTACYFLLLHRMVREGRLGSSDADDRGPRAATGTSAAALGIDESRCSSSAGSHSDAADSAAAVAVASGSAGTTDVGVPPPAAALAVVQPSQQDRKPTVSTSPVSATAAAEGDLLADHPARTRAGSGSVQSPSGSVTLSVTMWRVRPQARHGPPSPGHAALQSPAQARTPLAGPASPAQQLMHIGGSKETVPVASEGNHALSGSALAASAGVHPSALSLGSPGHIPVAIQAQTQAAVQVAPWLRASGATTPKRPQSAARHGVRILRVTAQQGRMDTAATVAAVSVASPDAAATHALPSAMETPQPSPLPPPPPHTTTTCTALPTTPPACLQDGLDRAAGLNGSKCAPVVASVELQNQRAGTHAAVSQLHDNAASEVPAIQQAPTPSAASARSTAPAAGATDYGDMYLSSASVATGALHAPAISHGTPVALVSGASLRSPLPPLSPKRPLMSPTAARGCARGWGYVTSGMNDDDDANAGITTLDSTSGAAPAPVLPARAADRLRLHISTSAGRQAPPPQPAVATSTALSPTVVQLPPHAVSRSGSLLEIDSVWGGGTDDAGASNEMPAGAAGGGGDDESTFVLSARTPAVLSPTHAPGAGVSTASTVVGDVHAAPPPPITAAAAAVAEERSIGTVHHVHAVATTAQHAAGAEASREAPPAEQPRTARSRRLSDPTVYEPGGPPAPSSGQFLQDHSKYLLYSRAIAQQAPAQPPRTDSHQLQAATTLHNALAAAAAHYAAAPSVADATIRLCTATRPAAAGRRRSSSTPANHHRPSHGASASPEGRMLHVPSMYIATGYTQGARPGSGTRPAPQALDVVFPEPGHSPHTRRTPALALRTRSAHLAEPGVNTTSMASIVAAVLPAVKHSQFNATGSPPAPTARPAMVVVMSPLSMRSRPVVATAIDGGVCATSLLPAPPASPVHCGLGGVPQRAMRPATRGRVLRIATQHMPRHIISEPRRDYARPWHVTHATPATSLATQSLVVESRSARTSGGEGVITAHTARSRASTATSGASALADSLVHATASVPVPPGSTPVMRGRRPLRSTSNRRGATAMPPTSSTQGAWTASPSARAQHLRPDTARRASVVDAWSGSAAAHSE